MKCDNPSTWLARRLEPLTFQKIKVFTHAPICQNQFFVIVYLDVKGRMLNRRFKWVELRKQLTSMVHEFFKRRRCATPYYLGQADTSSMTRR
jgi:hypothetical protein